MQALLCCAVHQLQVPGDHQGDPPPAHMHARASLEFRHICPFTHVAKNRKVSTSERQDGLMQAPRAQAATTCLAAPRVRWTLLSALISPPPTLEEILSSSLQKNTCSPEFLFSFGVIKTPTRRFRYFCTFQATIRVGGRLCSPASGSWCDRAFLCWRGMENTSSLILCYHSLSFLHCPHLQLSSTGCCVN